MAADASPKFHPPDLLELSLPPSPPHDGLHFYQFMAAGSVAGVVEHTSMFPVDTLKTLIQAHSRPCHPPLTLLQTLRSLPSPLSLYRGISAMALGAAPAHAVYFSVYEFSKKFLSERNPNPNLNPVVHAFSGVLATVSSDAVFTPMDTVKQRLQLQSSPYKGVVDCVRRVLKEEGLGALYRSYRTTVVMNAPFTAVHFSTYEAAKRGLMEISTEDITDEGRLAVHATAGAAAGALAAAVTTPLDVVKTQLQCQELSNEIDGALGSNSERVFNTPMAEFIVFRATLSCYFVWRSTEARSYNHRVAYLTRDRSWSRFSHPRHAPTFLARYAIEA